MLGLDFQDNKEYLQLERNSLHGQFLGNIYTSSSETFEPNTFPNRELDLGSQGNGKATGQTVRWPCGREL